MVEMNGTAGRSLGRRIGAVREGNDRAASNDNRPVEAPRGKEGKAKHLAGMNDRLSPRTTVRRGSRTCGVGQDAGRSLE